MTTSMTSQTAIAPSGTAIDPADPRAQLFPRMRAIGTGGKRLGKVDTLMHDALTGRLSALTIRHGLRGNKVTSIPAERVKWVNSNSVVLDLSSTAFKHLPLVAAD